MSEARPASSVTLRALQGAPLGHEPVREMVVATAQAIAERQGVELVSLATDDESITLTVAGPRMAAIGLAAELRRLTGRWYRGKFSGELWGSGGAEP